MGLRILVAPNEDGLGTSAWTVRLVKGLLRAGAETIEAIRVPVASGRLANFHRGKYPGLPVEIMRLEGVRHPLRLVKQAGGVDIPATLAWCVLDYERSREEYRQALRACRALDGADLLVDWGVPQMLRAAHDEAGRCGRRGRPLCVTVSDHAWSETLALMAHAAKLLGDRVVRGLQTMRADEALTDCVFTFPPPITPAERENYWRQTLHRPVERLPGVFGGHEVARRWAGGEPRPRIRRMLGIPEDAAVLHLTGGGTPVWDRLLTSLLDEYAARPPSYYVVVFSPGERQRRGVRLGWSGGVQIGRDPGAPRVIHLGDVAGETHHVLFAAFDLVCTRAGGGTVSDALAFGVPLLLVEETGHPQVEAIRESCANMGLARSVGLEEFLRSPRAQLEGRTGELRAQPAPRMGVGCHAEEDLAARLLTLARAGR
ncbi:MAG: hypothetical protein RMI94_06360 [Bryobacterales bacterium]|nr:hypothetical protein [Bryobacteraceae bacterium]MDW8130153.1 hypothetical protein [Bryobacterales bacterium]